MSHKKEARLIWVKALEFFFKMILEEQSDKDQGLQCLHPFDSPWFESQRVGILLIHHGLNFREFTIKLVGVRKINQRNNGPVNAYLISGPSKSTKQTKPGNKYEKDLINNS